MIDMNTVLAKEITMLLTRKRAARATVGNTRESLAGCDDKESSAGRQTEQVPAERLQVRGCLLAKMPANEEGDAKQE